MSDVSPESALALREGILVHDTWDGSHAELAGYTRIGFIAIDALHITPEQLPNEVRARLGVTDTSAPDTSRYSITLGRRHNRRYAELGHMYHNWPEGQEWNADFVYDDHGTDAAFVRVTRVEPGKDGGIEAVMLSAHYLVSAQESFEPGQPPLCDVRVELEDHMPMRRRMIELRNSGGGILELAAALGIDPMTGDRDLDKPEVESETDMWAGVAEAMGTPMSESEVEQMRTEEVATAEVRAAEGELQPLTTVEILGLAALVSQVETIGQC